MKKIIISMAALAAISTAALAERNYDISSPPVGETVFKTKRADTDARAFAAPKLIKKSGQPASVLDSYGDNNSKVGGSR
jgi:hypothetical protein